MLNQTAKELARDIGKGKLSSIEVTDFFIDRIEKHNPAVNAVIESALVMRARKLNAPMRW